MKKSKRTRPVNSPIPPEQVIPSPSWTIDDGISYSLLSKFINCRERFRLYAVEGAREERSSKAGMDWGTYFHELIELHAKHPKYKLNSLIKRCKTSLSPLAKAQAATVMDRYMWWYQDSTYDYFAQEDKFDIKYRLPNGRLLRLRGKTDEIIRRSDGTLMIQENKTKEKINPYKIESSIPWDLQSLMYATAIEKKYKRPVTGIVYNVIRKPTSEPKLKRLTAAEKKAGKKPSRETTKEYQERLRQDIELDPAHYFHRWEFDLSPEHMEHWRQSIFNPHLIQFCLWWDSIKHDPFSPWTTPDAEGELVLNPHHYLRPFGVYDALTTGTGDFFNLITRGRRLGVSVGNDPFEELN